MDPQQRTVILAKAGIHNQPNVILNPTTEGGGEESLKKNKPTLNCTCVQLISAGGFDKVLWN